MRSKRGGVSDALSLDGGLQIAAQTVDTAYEVPYVPDASCPLPAAA